MKKFIFYAVALLSVASLLNGCKKDDGNESKGPNVEGVFWFEEEEPAPGVMRGLYLKDGSCHTVPTPRAMKGLPC